MRVMPPRPSRRQSATAVATAAVAAGAGYVAAALADRRKIKSDPLADALQSPPQGERTTVHAADGTALHVRSYGPEDATPIVLVHGWTCAWRFWTHQISALSEDHRVVAFDLRGHGDSERPPHGDWTIDAFAADIDAVIDAALEPGARPLIAGHSLGAMATVAWASRQEQPLHERARAVALINTGMGDLITESLLIRTPARLGSVTQIAGRALLSSKAPLPRGTTPVSHRMVRYLAHGPTASPATVAFTEDMVFNTRRQARAGAGATLVEMDLHNAVAQLDLPALVIAGGADRLTPPVHAKRLAQDLPQLARYVEQHDSGHMTPLEHPALVNDLLRELALSAAPAAPAASGRA